MIDQMRPKLFSSRTPRQLRMVCRHDGVIEQSLGIDRFVSCDGDADRDGDKQWPIVDRHRLVEEPLHLTSPFVRIAGHASSVKQNRELVVANAGEGLSRLGLFSEAPRRRSAAVVDSRQHPGRRQST